jgi:hypothetical protein
MSVRYLVPQSATVTAQKQVDRARINNEHCQSSVANAKFHFAAADGSHGHVSGVSLHLPIPNCHGVGLLHAHLHSDSSAERSGLQCGSKEKWLRAA